MGLQVVIVGGGITGLAAAIALARTGHSITVLESRTGLAEIGAGIQLHPNATRILCEWGLREEFDAAADPTSTGAFRGLASGEAIAYVIRRYATGQPLCVLPLPGKKHDVPSWLVYRPDLLRILYDKAKSLGVDVRFDGKVVAVNVDSTAIDLEDGAQIRADLVLIADGIRSRTRSCIVPAEQAIPLVSNNAYRILIPRQVMLRDASTAELMNREGRQLWVGPHRFVIAYPIARGDYYNMVLEHPGQNTPGVWTNTTDLDVVSETFADFDPVVGKAIKLATKSNDWACARLPRLPTWTSPDGRVLLIGDAAHATTPQLSQGACMCIEDAAVLAECLRFRTSRDEDVAAATQAFVTIRRPRVEMVQDVSWANSRVFRLPDGPEQETRDREMRWGDSRIGLMDYDAVAEVSPSPANITGCGNTDHG